MKWIAYVFGGFLLLKFLGGQQAGSSASVTNPANQTTLVDGTGQQRTVIFNEPARQVVLDESGDLAFINSTGGTTVLPDPNGIGGGFAT